MSKEIRENIQKLFVVGISYRKTALEVRGSFSLSTAQQELLLEEAKQNDIKGILVLSTCNRTEIYCHHSDSTFVRSLFLKYCKGTKDEFETHGYIYKGKECIDHLYTVSSGMDSQILGDFQIIGQVKEAYRISEEQKLINPFLNRLFSSVFATSKKIKNETELSKGASSVAHASVQYIKDKVENLETSRFLLLGTGEIGKLTCDNLLKHMKNRSLTLINRSAEKAESLAKKYSISHKGMDQLAEAVDSADVIIVATGAPEPTLRLEHFKNITAHKLILDLSVPRNVDPQIDNLENTVCINVDGLAKHISSAMKHREDSIPKAQAIIDKSIAEFYSWLEIKYLSPVIIALKENLHRIQEKELDYHRSKLTAEEIKKVEHITNNIVNKIARACINHLKDHHKSQSSPMETLNMIFKDTH